MKNVRHLFFLIFLLISNIIMLKAQPQLPSDFWGAVLINGTNAPVGTIITPTINGISYPASYTVKSPGIYGMLSVNGDDPSTVNTKEGGVNGDQIIFKATVGAVVYTLSPAGSWQSTATQRLDLSGSGSIPVELASFCATVSENSVLLNWTTASESENYGFEIQRSADQTSFLKIGFVNGHGTTSVPQQYSFVDELIKPEKYFYQLKQIDTDGAFTLSNIIEADLTLVENFSLAQNYPNPFNPNTTIEYGLPQAEMVTITIYDVNGKLVRNLLARKQSEGIHSVEWDSRDNNGVKVSSGVYFHHFKAGDFTQTNKMILMK